MTLNPNKTKVIVVGRHQDLGGRGEIGTLIVDGIQPPHVPQVYSYEMLLGPLLHLDSQVAVVPRSAFQQLYQVEQVHPFLSVSNLVTII